jgi:uncharacterized protein YdcH (DUF465 family)
VLDWVNGKLGSSFSADGAIDDEAYAAFMKQQYGIDIAAWEATIAEARAKNLEIESKMIELLGEQNSDLIKSVMTNMTVEGNENMLKALTDFTEFYDKDFGEGLLNYVDSFAKTLDEESLEEFYEVFGEITDYTDASQWEHLIDALAESEEWTEAETDALKIFVDESINAANAIKEIDFTKLTEQLSTLKDTIDKIANGEIEFSDEEVLKLKETGIDTSDFVKTLDGYRFIGDSTELL